MSYSLRYWLVVGCCCLSSLAYPCGPGKPAFYGYQLMRTDLLTQATDFDAYFLRFEDFAGQAVPELPVQSVTNIDDWQAHLCDYVRAEDLRYLIYEAPSQDLELLRTAARSKNVPLPRNLQGNTFADMLAANRCTGTVDYLLFAKRVEPYVVAPADPWSTETPDYPAMLALIDEGRRLFRGTDSDYLRLRYTYQLVRLAHYAKAYDRALELYDELVPKYEPQESIINYWLLGHRAGALMGLGRNVEAARLYNLIFLHSPGKRESALRSIRIRSAEEWRQVLVRSESDTERASLYALRARQTEGNATADLRAVYALDPHHPFLRTLLLREIRKLERNLLGLDVNFHRRRNQRLYGVPQAWAGTYVIELQELVREIAAEKRVRQPLLWELAEGYLELIAGDLTGAANTFAEVAPRIRNDTLRSQLEAFEVALYLLELEEVDEGVERRLDELRDDSRAFRRYQDLPKLMRDKLYLLYQRDNQPGKAFLTHRSFAELRRQPDELIIEDLLKMTDQEDLTGIERLLINRSGAGNLRNDLHDLKAMQLMREGQFEAALRIFKEIPRTEWDSYGRYNPFVPQLNDCVNCPRADTLNYNRGELIERLIEMEYEARSDPLRAALNYFRIGVALYNMTYFGPEWRVLANYRSATYWNCLPPANRKRSYCEAQENIHYTDISRALYYFEKARLLAERPELAAGATFWAAKCELLQFYQSEAYRDPGNDRIPIIPEAYRRHYQILKTEYADTKVYDRVVSECAFFRAYL